MPALLMREGLYYVRHDEHNLPVFSTSYWDAGVFETQQQANEFHSRLKKENIIFWGDARVVEP